MRHRLSAWCALLRRYRQVWLHFWRQRRQLTPLGLQAQEAEFLPAALSIQAQPVSPAGRWIARVLIVMALTLLAWAVLGKVDIIVNGQGKIIPSERTKTMTAVEVASVRGLYVKEGQRVKAGDLLIELDSRGSDADADKAQSEWQNAFLQAARSRCLLEALNRGSLGRVPLAQGVEPRRWDDAQRQLEAQWRDVQAKRRRLDDEIGRYGKALPLAIQRATDYADLLKTRDVSEHAWVEKEQQRIEIEGQFNDARNQKAALLAETRKNAEDALNDALRIMATAKQDAKRANVHGELLRLVSPIAGTVQQLAAHTVGAAVPAAQPLMQIVPIQSVVELEAFIENKDVGFVQEGQSAEVKIDAFEYTKYGTVPARVTHVSRDAIQDDKKGLIYAIKVELAHSQLVVDGREVAMSPGMSGSVEIKTGTRRVIEYVLSPLMQHAHESLHER